MIKIIIKMYKNNKTKLESMQNQVSRTNRQASLLLTDISLSAQKLINVINLKIVKRRVTAEW